MVDAVGPMAQLQPPLPFQLPVALDAAVGLQPAVALKRQPLHPAVRGPAFEHPQQLPLGGGRRPGLPQLPPFAGMPRAVVIPLGLAQIEARAQAQPFAGAEGQQGGGIVGGKGLRHVDPGSAPHAPMRPPWA